MARMSGRKPKKMMTSEDTHRFIRVRVSHNGSTTSTNHHILDIGRQMSAMNRRLYRQGGTYHIANISIVDTAGDVDISFAGLPTTWPVQAAWKQAFQLWKKQRASVQDVSNISSKWSDFKVYLSDDSRSYDVLNFNDSEGDALGTGDWDQSKMFLDEDGDNTDDFFLHMMGSNNGSLPGGTCVSASLLANFEDVLQIPQSEPDVPANANQSLFVLMARAGADTELNKDLVDAMEVDNDQPPYSQTLVPGAKTSGGDPWVYREISIKASEQPAVMIPGFAVPLGLVDVKTVSSSGTASNPKQIELVIELVPGSYKGIQYESWA
jgi:hypothetical protein